MTNNITVLSENWIWMIQTMSALNLRLIEIHFIASNKNALKKIILCLKEGR